MGIIESYSFGQMVTGGTRYTKDVIIYPDGNILSPWWRNRGHLLEPVDLKDLIATTPELIICGTGAMGFMRLSVDLKEFLEVHNIDFISQKSSKAVITYNRLSGTRKVGGCFHLSC